MGIVLTDREATLMEVLWESGPSTVSEVRSQLSDELAYTTVLTILRNLEHKGYLTHEQEGRRHRYSVVIDRIAAQQSALRALKESLFQGSTVTLLARIVADMDLSQVQMERIKLRVGSVSSGGGD